MMLFGIMCKIEHSGFYTRDSPVEKIALKKSLESSIAPFDIQTK